MGSGHYVVDDAHYIVHDVHFIVGAVHYKLSRNIKEFISQSKEIYSGLNPILRMLHEKLAQTIAYVINY